jgi:hypothetical protein
VQSVISYAAENDTLPDGPDDTLLEPSRKGFEDIVRSPKDGFTNDLYYIPDDNLDDAGSSICGRKTTTISVKNCPDAACATPTSTIPNVAFVVISGAGNFNVQTDRISNVVNVYEFGTASIDDCQDSNDCPTAAKEGQDLDRQDSYDDFVMWVNLAELKTKAGCVGPPLKILNNEFPFGVKDSAYSSVTVLADGGVPFSSGGQYRWCRQESASTGLVFTPSTLSADCSGLSEASWGQSDSLAISGTPTTSGSFKITFFVRDNNDSSSTDDSIVQKKFVLTLHPSS